MLDRAMKGRSDRRAAPKDRADRCDGAGFDRHARRPGCHDPDRPSVSSASMPGQPIGVKHVALALDVSRRTLDRRFVALLGRTVHDELIAVHMQIARRLLTDGPQPDRRDCTGLRLRDGSLVQPRVSPIRRLLAHRLPQQGPHRLRAAVPGRQRRPNVGFAVLLGNRAGGWDCVLDFRYSGRCCCRPILLPKTTVALDALSRQTAAVRSGPHGHVPWPFGPRCGTQPGRVYRPQGKDRSVQRQRPRWAVHVAQTTPATTILARYSPSKMACCTFPATASVMSVPSSRTVITT